MILRGMLDLCGIIFETIFDLFRPRAALEAEIFVLRTDRRAATGQPGPGAIFGCRQDGSGLGLPAVSESPRSASDRSARHCSSVASRKFPVLLALEVEASSGPSRGAD
jgi:hypothetical protein